MPRISTNDLLSSNSRFFVSLTGHPCDRLPVLAPFGNLTTLPARSPCLSIPQRRGISPPALPRAGLVKRLAY